MNDSLYLKAAHGEPLEQYPVWIQRQAGRYMASYRALREKYVFNDLLTNPELGAEITLQPIKTFGFDAAILFSDILVLPKALGFTIDFVEGKGPITRNPITDPEAIANLTLAPIEETVGHVMEEIALLIPELNALDTPLIGFAGAPFTVMSYLLSTESGHDLKTVKTWAYTHEEALHHLLGLLTEATIAYAEGQIRAGVHAFQLFDSWSNALSSPQFDRFSLPYLKKIVLALKRYGVPLALFGLGNSVHYPKLLDTGFTILGFDAAIDLPRLRDHIPKTIALQGNVDPYLLLSDTKTIQERTRRFLDSLNAKPGHIVNLGHGILPYTSEDAVKAFVDTVKLYHL